MVTSETWRFLRVCVTLFHEVGAFDGSAATRVPPHHSVQRTQFPRIASSTDNVLWDMKNCAAFEIICKAMSTVTHLKKTEGVKFDPLGPHEGVRADPLSLCEGVRLLTPSG